VADSGKDNGDNKLVCFLV